MNTFIASFLGAGVGASLLGFLLKDWLAVRIKDAIDREALVHRSSFEVKRDACMDALSVVDAAFSQQPWSQSGAAVPITKQPLKIAKARECYNRLALTCTNPAVIERYTEALGLGGPDDPPRTVNAAAIVDLRNAMRTELGFGSPLAPPDRVAAWIAKLHGDE